jgi:hypothetical protein
MASDIFAVPSFNDLKLKEAGQGGFSDGGIVSESVALMEVGGNPNTVEIAPPPGVVLGGVRLDFSEDPAGVCVANFDANPVSINEYFVTEDGTEVLTQPSTVAGQAVNAVSAFFEGGGFLQYPNKLRYKIDKSNPTQRVLLKYTLMLFDRPADQG